MFIMVIRKMVSNKWMVLCLLLGFILAVAMVSSIPMYTDGVLQRMLIKDLENYQISSGHFPGRYHVSANIYSQYAENSRIKAFHILNNKIKNEAVNEIGLPIMSCTSNLTIDYLIALPEVQREEEPKKRSLKLEALEGLEDHVEIIHGRMYSSEKQGGVYEAIVTEEAMKNLDLRLDEVYVVSDFIDCLDEPLKVKVVGVFTIADEADPFWFQGLWAYAESFLIDYSLFYDEFIEGESPLLTKAQWYYAFDYHKISLDNTPKILEAFEAQNRWFAKRKAEFRMPAISVLEQYYEREKQLKTTLWVIQVPILLMLAFYLLMVSKLIIEQEQNEIAVLKSRGASSLQIFMGYLVESLILGGVALAVGPPVGLFLCKLLGAANGFMEFVQRTALPLKLSPKAYLYSLAAVGLSMVTMLVPAFLSSKTTIVKHKQEKARGGKRAFWKKYFLDVLLLAAAGYGLYSYKLRQSTLEITGAEATELAIDPLLFLVSTLFILGTGLLILRIYPYFVKLIFYLGRNKWSPVLYASFIQVGRSGGQDRFLMLFLILTLSIGVFNANAARTLNNNLEEKIYYANGADIVLEAYWPSNQPKFMPMEPMGEAYSSSNKEPVQYIEPPFLPYTELKGVELATKVFINDSVTVQNSTRDYTGRTTLMGIIPNEFGKVAWFRNDLLKTHWYHYLNLMSHHPMAALVSRSFAEEHNVRKGDSLWLSWGDQGYLEVIVYEFVDYWPTYNPKAKQGKESANLVVANLDYIQANSALEPYQVWLKKEPGATSGQIYQDIEDKGLQIEKLTDAGQQIIIKKNDPMVQGTNGALTLGFIVTMSVSTIGFLIYWILSIRQRELQFGIFRAMGMSVKKVIGLLACEQVLISGTAILVGVIIGGIASDLFVPLLQMAYSAAQQVPPFKVVAAREDYIKIYMVVLSMLAVGLSVLGIITSKIKIYQAIKLGED